MNAPAGPLPRLHVITDDRILARAGFLEEAGRVLEAGPRVALHVRGPAATARTVWELADSLRSVATASGAVLLVNDRADVALAAGADGVHLGERSLPVAAARRLFPPPALVGASVHGAERAREAAAAGADYLVAGTVYATPSHPDWPGRGTGFLRRIAADSGVPILAIGGVAPERVTACVGDGAYGVAVLSGVWDARDPMEAVAGYLERLAAVPPVAART